MPLLESKWNELRVADSSVGFSERILRLKTWLELALRQETEQAEESTVALVDEVWTKLIINLIEAYKQSPHPLSGISAIAWEQAKTLCDLRIAYVAKQFGPPPPPPRFSFFKKPARFKSYSHLASLSILRQAYIAYAHAYRLPPRGFWSLSHTMFRKSVGLEGDDQIFKLTNDLSEAAKVYRQLLVYALANPYALRAGYLTIATQLLDYFCPLARFLDVAPVQDGARGLVVVSLDTDQMPRTIARADPGSFSSSFLYVQLHDLTYELQQAAEAIARGGTLPVNLTTNVEITRREIIEVIQASLRAFAGIAARAIPRVPAAGPIDVVCGFYNAWNALSSDVSEQSPSGIERAEVVNQTITGVAFRIEGKSQFQLRVGEVLLFRRPGQPLWRISVARWIEIQADSGAIMVGCQAIGLRSDAYTATDQEGLDVPIIVAQVPNHVGDTTVLLPDQGIGTDAQLSTRDGESSATIVLTDLRETHVDCARYQFLTV